HFHALYSEHEASIAIESLEVLRGDLPPRVLRLVEQWVSLHRRELLKNWDLAEQGKGLESIDALP
ncbi:MAG TPA: DUF4160 domain-containing protein, partial [Solirubrobacterales bacterium]|nr:DUF4160 domain-containing protein [Solirubrobacterales bacterium]